MTARPLEGIRVLEMGQLLAGPFAGAILGYYGAEVIKIEPPGSGDPPRVWRLLEDGTSLWWRSLGRNKKCVTLDLRKDWPGPALGAHNREVRGGLLGLSEAQIDRLVEQGAV